MTYRTRSIDCPSCNDGTAYTGSLWTKGICDDCHGTQRVDASCACCDRLEALDDEGFCRDCSEDVSLTECVGDPLLKRRAA